MKYDSEKNLLFISVSELVAIARRGISKTLPHDEDEPRTDYATDRQRRLLLGDDGSEHIEYAFNTEYSFLLTGYADKIEGNCITIIRIVSGSVNRIKRDELANIRGEGFILSKMLIERLVDTESISLTIIYLDADGRTVTATEELSRRTLDSFFDKCKSTLCVYARPEIERVTERLPSMKKIKFPYPEIREGQSDFIRAVYRNLARGTTLYATAPTGTGKTVSVIYPAIRTLGDGRIDKVFYLTPKTTTAEVARECLELFVSEGAKIRTVILSSKERCCRSNLACRDGRDKCKYTKYNRLPDAVMALYELGLSVVSEKEAEKIAVEYSICTHELLLTYSELCDFVICDINYLFDPTVYIRRFFDTGGRYAFLIDEAHNLADRAREMYSAEFSSDSFDLLLSSPLIGPVSRLREPLEAYKKTYTELLLSYLKDEIRVDKEGVSHAAVHLSDVPSELYGLMEGLEKALDDELLASFSAEDEDSTERTRLIKDELYRVKKINSTLRLFDSHFKLFMFLDGDLIRLKLFCTDTHKVIEKALSKGQGAVFFSATLSPLDYYKSLLGGNGSSEVIEVESPFHEEALSVSIMDKISTRYSERERTAPAIIRVIGATLSARRGNYMVFAPSFEYLDLLAEEFKRKYPKTKALIQRKNMSAKEKSDFLKEFTKEEDSYLVGFCVLGGIYSEGVDLVGEGLIGAIVVGIGMPSISYEREAMAEYYEEKYESGKQFAYIYPGLNRVLQAAGRVIRRENDRGVIVLIDDRFQDPIYKKSIPSLWHGMEYVGDAKELNERVKEFWRGVDEENGRE